MARDRHDERLRSQIMQLTADFLNREANKLSLITVTGLELSGDGKQAAVLISVYPETEEKWALGFVRRKRGEIVGYIRDHLRTRFLPRLDFDIDVGEKHRQRIDEIINKEK